MDNVTSPIRVQICIFVLCIHWTRDLFRMLGWQVMLMVMMALLKLILLLIFLMFSLLMSCLTLSISLLSNLLLVRLLALLLLISLLIGGHRNKHLKRIKIVFASYVVLIEIRLIDNRMAFSSIKNNIIMSLIIWSF